MEQQDNIDVIWENRVCESDNGKMKVLCEMKGIFFYEGKSSGIKTLFENERILEEGNSQRVNMQLQN